MKVAKSGPGACPGVVCTLRGVGLGPEHGVSAESRNRGGDLTESWPQIVSPSRPAIEGLFGFVLKSLGLIAGRAAPEKRPWRGTLEPSLGALQLFPTVEAPAQVHFPCTALPLGLSFRWALGSVWLSLRVVAASGR